MFTSFTYSSDADVRNWYRRVLREGEYAVSSTRMTLLETLIGGLKTDGVWSKLDRLWIKAAQAQKAALVGFDGALLTAVGSPTFTIDRGFTGQDASPTSQYIITNFNPGSGAAGQLFALNSAHFSAWCVGNVATVSAAGSLMGHYSGNCESSLYVTSQDGNVYGRINENPGSGAQGAPGTRAGHWLINRNGTSTTQLYQNGSLFSNPNGSSSGVTLPTASNFALLCDWNQSGANGIVGNPNQVAAATIGGSLSSTDVSNLYSRLRTYMTAVGVP